DIEFTDGRLGFLYFREDGTLKEAREIYPDHKTVKQDVLFGPDGKTALESQVFRQDGTLSARQVVQSDGSTRTTKYYAGGKAVRQDQVSRADGTADVTWYRQDGTLWAKYHAVNS